MQPGIVTWAAGDLEGAAQIAHREGGALCVRADDREAADLRVRKVERRLRSYQSRVVAPAAERLNAGGNRVVDQQREIAAGNVHA